MKKYLKVAVKVVLTAAALYIVFLKIDFTSTLKVFSRVNLPWLFLAFIAFNLSKLISALRFMNLYGHIGLFFEKPVGIKLTYIGMFYNLFLPGGIGGDGYKVYLIKKHFKSEKLKKIITAALLDRISGLVALVFLCLPILTQTSTYFLFSDPRINFTIFAIIMLYYPLAILINRLTFRSFKKAFPITDFQSLGVQIGQLLCAFLILKSLGVSSFHFDYLELFLLSSIAAVLPLTIGGVGIRELVFVYGYKYLVIDKNTAIAFTLTFFLMTVVSSLVGAFLNVDKELKSFGALRAVDGGKSGLG